MPPEVSKRERITIKAKELLADAPNGLRFSELAAALGEAFPGEAYGNITGSIWNLNTRCKDEIYKPSRGLFRLLRFKDSAEEAQWSADAGSSTTNEVTSPTRHPEHAFYQPFADWLMNGDLEECTKAIPLGGSRFREKWGTPDVIGIFKSRDKDLVKILEVVVAEIKVEAQLITAFGQACAYRLFAHKSYLVVPRDCPKEDIDRLDALCMSFGIGLILFDSTNQSAPAFQIRVRAARHEPDSYYANKYLMMVAEELGL